MRERQGGWKILVVEDEPRLIQFVAPLKAEGFEVSVAHDGVEALRAIRTERPDLVILDPELPWADERVPAASERPNGHLNGLAVIVTGGASRATKAAADDYLARPFRPRDLVARIRQLQTRKMSAHVLRAGPIEVDRSRWAVTVEGRPAALTATEFRLLWRLLEAKGHVVSREALQGVWGAQGRAHGLETRTVDVHVGRLRRKLGAGARWIITERGVGYRLRR